ncbi:MAG: alpha/beta hydrolase, partial [Planctomycetes bacterium]|nr:alpha/beta hydrolase [Planctomycetota bacterium]
TSLPWSAPIRFGSGNVEAITMIQSNFGSPGNLELIARVGDQLQLYWRDSGPTYRWNGPFPLLRGAQGNPVLIQSRFGTKGNFELAVPAVGGGIMFAFRNNDNTSLPWSAPIRFGSGNVEAITMIQSNFGSPGNLELIARVGDQLQFYWRDSGPVYRWNGPFPITTLPN